MNEACLLKGVEEIASYLGMSVEAAKKLIQRNRIPTFKLGHTRYARPATLLAFIEKQEQAQLAAMNDNGQRKADAPPYQVGDDVDGLTAQHVETLRPGIHFIGMAEGFAAIQISAEDLARIPEPWQTAFPYRDAFGGGWIDWQVKQPRRRRKAA